MTELVAALVAFLLTHGVLAAPGVRGWFVGRVGERGFLVLYSVLSVGLLVWLGRAYGAAPYVEVWPQAAWTRWVPVLAMPLACLLLIVAVSAANPLSVGVGQSGFVAARPGPLSITRHPLIWAFAIWAGAHLFPNGDVASLLLFGPLLGLSLYGPVSLDAKRRAKFGAAEWRRLSAATSNLPFAAILAGRTGLAGFGLWRIALAGVLYSLLLKSHAGLIGVSPMPGH